MFVLLCIRCLSWLELAVRQVHHVTQVKETASTTIPRRLGLTEVVGQIRAAAANWAASGLAAGCPTLRA